MKTCKDCKIDKEESNFYCKDRKTGRLSNYCSLCENKGRGIKNPGILLQSIENFKKGLIKCSDCNTIKPLESFNKNKSYVTGYSTICKNCSHLRVRSYRQNSKNNLTPHYLKRFAIENYYIKHEDITPEILEIAKLHIQAKRADKLFLDGLKFNTIKSFARYVSEKYNLTVNCVLGRIRAGHTEQDCIISEHKFRSSNQTKIEKIVVTNVITNEIKSFLSKYEATNQLKISVLVIQKCLDTGEIRKPYNNSKNKSLLKFEYAK